MEGCVYAYWGNGRLELYANLADQKINYNIDLGIVRLTKIDGCL
jgi:hypothetical protein